MALNTGKKIVRCSWDVIPMPDTVIARVNTLGVDQPEQLVFTDRHGRLIGDDDDVDMPGVDDLEDDDEIPGVPIPRVDFANLTGVDEALPEVKERRCRSSTNQTPHKLLILIILTHQLLIHLPSKP